MKNLRDHQMDQKRANQLMYAVVLFIVGVVMFPITTQTIKLVDQIVVNTIQ